MTRTFQRFAAGSAVVAAAAGVVFTVAFAVVVREGERWAQWVSWTTLLGGALATLPVMAALHARLGKSEPQFALVGFVLGVGGALGAAVHAAFELSELANPSSVNPDTPNPVDPRGVLTFAVTGLALGLFGWLVLRAGGLPRSAGGLGVAAAVLLVVVYIGRLTVQDPNTNVIKVAALVAGLAVVPAFYLQVGRALLRDDDNATRPVAVGASA